MTDKLTEMRKKYKENPTDNHFLDKLTFTLSQKILDLGEEGKMEEADKLLTELKSLAENNLTNESVIINYGKTVLNSMPMYFGRETQTELKDKINQFRELSIKSKNNKLVEFLSMILVNAIYDFSLSNQTPSLHEFSMELIDLARANPDNFLIQTSCSKGMMNSILYFQQKNDTRAAKGYFEQLMKIVERHPNKEMVDSRRLIQLKEIFGYEK